MARHNTFGTHGELLAKKYFEEQGYEILEGNWTFKKAEIDLILYKDSTIIFAEVKTRKNNTFAEPEDFVGQEKQKLIAMAAGEYIHLMDHRGEVRFDIISILFDKFGNPMIRHIEDAFWP
ncbi:MAG: YraN family protein [Pedobacter sp.]|jgi:putative endonuclease